MYDKLRASLKISLLVLWLLMTYAALWAAKMLRRPHVRDRVIRLCNHGLLVIIGVRLTVSGELARERPLLLVTNHVSYLDIVLIAACATVKFTPKSEIGGWFFIGGFCRLCGSIFIDRRADKVAAMKQRLHDALATGDAVCLFPEATTGEGVTVKEFKSGFFNLAQEDFGDTPLYVQPAAVVYTQIGGLPIDRMQWPKLAWYGDMELAPHLWELLMLPGIGAEMVFLPPIRAEGVDRKVLAKQCQEAVSGAIQGVRSRQRLLTPAKPTRFNPTLLRKK
ncbi:MAG: 1-acyl-sn-glycerol-3-phosphate acyltransferase [Rickettsiales bacterium]|nr:1-acyl-sn-glycerol-3-phosphate acyltransferase [Rickettsiales bacterium]